MAPRIVCVAGPTACGKTKMGVLLAKAFNGEVVSADSMQIYRGLTIGTAAPTPEEMEGVPHHMVAVADVTEPWSAARYVQSAIPVVDDILRRGKLPIVVGGTGLWVDALVRGRSFAPGAAGGTVRQELQERLAREGIEPLLKELRTVDPDAAARLHPRDEKRILRALEVYRETGMTITAHNAAEAALPNRYDEVDWLLSQDLPPSATALQAIGYKEFAAVRTGQATVAQAVEEVKLRSRQYAKRQLTWLRRNQDIHWILWEKERDFARALQISTKILSDAGVC